MGTPRARILEFAVDLDEAWAATSDRGGAPLPDDPETWTPEHLVLAALARCALTSLRHHARRAGSDVRATARAHGTVTRREADGRFAFVEIEVAIEGALDPPLAAEALADVRARAERDCFVGASLAVAPAYRLVVEGTEIG